MFRYKWIKLLAPISADYGDKYIRFLVVNNIQKYVNKLIKSGAECINAKKTASVEYIICDSDMMRVDTYAMAIHRGRLYKILEATNIAQKGDFVILQNGDLLRQYRMSIDTALKRYKFDPKKHKGKASPIEQEQCFVKVDKNIAFVSPWGSMMYLVKGGYLNITEHHIYAIQNYSFEHTYTKIEKTTA